MRYRNDPDGTRLPEFSSRYGVPLDRRDYREDADPAFVTYGPKTRREFLNPAGVEPRSGMIAGAHSGCFKETA